MLHRVKRRELSMGRDKAPMSVFTVFVHEMTGFLTNPVPTQRDLFTTRVVEGVVEGPKGVKMGSMRDVVLPARF